MAQKALRVLALIGVVGCQAIGGEPIDRRAFNPYVDGEWIGAGVSYGPFRDGQSPGGAQPTEAQMLEDLRLMGEHWTLFRMYGSSGATETVCRLIKEHDLPMRIMVGAWIEKEYEVAEDRSFGARLEPGAAMNRRQVDTAIRLANEFPGIVHAINIGNESQVSWSDHRVPLETLIGYIREARAATDVPVTTCDDYNFWNKPESKKVAAECDFIGWHGYAMWNGQSLVDAMTWTRDQLAGARALHPGIEFVHCETGWATKKHNEGMQAELIKGEPGERQQELFYHAYTGWAREQGLAHFYFEAFDENWKGGDHPDEVEKHWGLFRADRSKKMAID